VVADHVKLFLYLCNWHGGVVCSHFYLWMEFSQSLKRSALKLYLNHYRKVSGRVIAIELEVRARVLWSVYWKKVWIITVAHVASKLLEHPSVILPYIIMAGVCAKVIRSHPTTMLKFPTKFIVRRPHRSIVRPPRRQPTGLEIAYTLAETREIVC
jgi:hypothetical protein